MSSATTNITVTPTINRLNTIIQVRINGGTYDTVISGSASPILSLISGGNTINVLVTSTDNNPAINYTKAICRINEFGTASSTPTLRINTPLTNITHTTIGATGIGSASGLPPGVSAVWANNTITISGTPTSSGVFNYSIPLTGGCGSVNVTGTITVTCLPPGGAASSAPTLLVYTPLTTITHTTIAATGIGTAISLPA